MTDAELDQIAERTAERLKRKLSDGAAKMHALERRVDALEAKSLSYRGVWEGKITYKRGDAVTFGGSLWVCRKAETTARPGNSDGWQLAVKKGRDGRRITTKGNRHEYERN